MGKSRRRTLKEEEPKPEQRVLPMLEILVRSKLALHELIVETGMQVLESLLEEDRVAICGPKSRPQEEQKAAYRHGFDQGQLVLGGRKVSIRKPRCRSVDGEEIMLPVWQELGAEDPLCRRMLEQMLIGVSTRKYERSLEDLPAPASTFRSETPSTTPHGPRAILSGAVFNRWPIPTLSFVSERVGGSASAFRGAVLEGAVGPRGTGI